VSELGKAGSFTNGHTYDPTPPGMLSSKGPNEEKVYQKLAELNKALDSQTPSQRKERAPPTQTKSKLVETANVDRLEEMMQTVQSNNEPDAELERSMA
jgi:hypothetical protein